MGSPKTLEQAGVAILASRMCELGNDPCGGSEVVLWEDREILRNTGIPVRVYGRAAHNGAPVTKLAMRTRLPLISSLEYCGGLLLREHRSVLISYNEPTIAALAPSRAIVRFDWSTALPKYWKLPGWLSRFQRGLYLFPSESERQSFLRLYPLIPNDSTVVVPNGVDLKLFRPAKGADGGLRVGYAGQWSQGKGVSQLLGGWGLVRKQLPTAELYLAGGARLWKNVTTSPVAEPLAKRVERMAKEGLLQIVGELKRSEMSAFWNSVSVAVVPSLCEAFGLVALEALACGVPVVASAVGGLREIIVDGECGLLVPPNDPRKLAEALVSLLSNEPLRKRLAEGARRRAEAFSLERRSEALLGLLSRRAEMR